MSTEPHAADHVYRRLKSDVMAGHYAPLEPLNVHSIAIEIGMSITPVRDAMERLVGERLLAVRGGGGFQMPAVTEAGLRDLYLWHSQLLRGAVRAGAKIDLPGELTDFGRTHACDDATVNTATTVFFDAIAALPDNEEYRIALRTAGERLHALRLRESRCIKDRGKELAQLISLTQQDHQSLLRNALGHYHRRRIRHIRVIFEALYHHVHNTKSKI